MQNRMQLGKAKIILDSFGFSLDFHYLWAMRSGICCEKEYQKSYGVV